MSAKPTLLLIDDEERILRSLAMLFRGSYELLTTTDPREALMLVASRRVHVVVSDQRMPVMRGADLLKIVKERSPNTMRILLTGYSEMEAILASVNEGEIFRFVTKPWDAGYLREIVQQAAGISQALFTSPAPAPGAAPEPVVVTPPAGEAILVLDDDAEVVRAVQEIAGHNHAVLWARGLDAAMEMLERQSIGVIVSELAVGGSSVAGFLKLLKAGHPEVVTLVLTPFQDVGVFIGLINQGQVFRLLPKPVRRGPLSVNISSAVRHHRALKASPILLSTHQVQKLAQPDAELGSGVAARVMGFLSRLRGRNSVAA